MLTRFASAHGLGSNSQEVLRYSVECALREIIAARDWTCLRRLWRVPLQAPVTGTATYDSATSTLTLVTGATAAWMVDGQVHIGTSATPCDIDSVASATELVLRSPRVPTESIATATAVTIGRYWYELPADFVASWAPAERNAWYVGEYVPFEDWHLLQKYYTTVGTVRRWTIGPAPNRYATLAIYVDPWPSATSEYDLVMKCRPRSLAVSGQEAWSYEGTVSVTADSATVTGTSSNFKSIMAGGIIRFSDSSTKPTGTNGSNPYIFQQSIASVDTVAQTMTLGSVAPVSLTNVKYVVSDPVDIDIAIYDAFLRNCEKQLAHACAAKDLPTIERQYQVALVQAKINDNYRRQHETAGSGHRVYRRLADEFTE